MNDTRNTSDDANDPFAPPVPREITPRSGSTYDAEVVAAQRAKAQLLAQEQLAKQPLRPRDVDSAETAFMIRIAVWSMSGGALAAAAVGTILYVRNPKAMTLGIVISFVLGWLATYHIVTWFVNRAGSGAAAIVFPSGATTPGARQYSLAQSYVVRGLFAQAATEYEHCTMLYPTDPEPFLRLARLYRDDLQRYDDAILWFKRTLAIANLAPGTETMAMRELIEVFTHRVQQPVAAAPWLARLAARYPGTPAGEWAKQQLAETKSAISGASLRDG